MTDIGIDTALSVPIYRQLKNWCSNICCNAFIIWISLWFSGGEKEVDGNMIMDSQAIK
ncbi:MAG: hypothetical protein CM15mV76_380 [uncultured marine virus]|nr:MAG: hypothetical protein CM15mV76_380 [uncultured marine virus]